MDFDVAPVWCFDALFGFGSWPDLRQTSAFASRTTVLEIKTAMCSGMMKIRAQSAVTVFAVCPLADRGVSGAGGASGVAVVTFGGEGGAPGEAQTGCLFAFCLPKESEVGGAGGAN